MPSTPADGIEEALARFYALDTRERDEAYVQRKQSQASAWREQAAAWRKVRFALDGADTVLDWGCRHGVLAWLTRQQLGDAVSLHGCDTIRARSYIKYHEAIGLHYQQLPHPWQLPYDDDHFDVVLGGGVLEHVANDGHSLTELWRVLKPGGRLVLSHLPNAGSYSEWLARRFWPAHAHLRRYRIKDLRRRLLARGLVPLRWGHHHLIPSIVPHADRRPRLAGLIGRVHRLDPLLERVWPLNRLSATLWIVAEKRPGL